MFEQTPMGRAADETLAQNYKGRNMGDGIRRKMVKLGPEVIHDALEERMRGQRKTSVDMAEEQDALPLPGRWLDLVLRRQSPGLVHEHSVLHQLQQIPFRHRGGEEVSLDPPHRQWPLPPLSRRRRLALLLPRLHLAGMTLGHGGDGEPSGGRRRNECRSAGGGEEGGAGESERFGERNEEASPPRFK